MSRATSRIGPRGPERLRSARDVTAVLRRGRRRVRSSLALHVLATESSCPSRLAVVASRRVGNAPTRNRAKRLLREAAARVQWPIGHDVVLVARPAIRTASMWDVHADVAALATELLGAPSHVGPRRAS